MEKEEMKQLKLVTLLLLVMALVVACGGSPATSAPAVAGKAAAKPAAQPGSKPAPAEKKADWDKIAADVSKAVGFTKYEYDAWELPAETKWADTLAYYDGVAASNGWGATHGQVADIDGGHYGVWKVADASGATAFLVIFQINSADGKVPTYTLAIIGN